MNVDEAIERLVEVKDSNDRCRIYLALGNKCGTCPFERNGACDLYLVIEAFDASPELHLASTIRGMNTRITILEKKLKHMQGFFKDLGGA
jgi:hypothetical protein